MLLSLFSPQYGLFWAICPFPIIKYIHTYKWTDINIPLAHHSRATAEYSFFLNNIYLLNLRQLLPTCPTYCIRGKNRIHFYFRNDLNVKCLCKQLYKNGPHYWAIHTYLHNHVSVVFRRIFVCLNDSQYTGLF